MGKIKQVIIGDEQAEEAARKKAAVRREQKKILKAKEGGTEVVSSEPVQEPIVNDDTPTPKEAVKKGKSEAKKYHRGHGKKYLVAQKEVEKKSYSLKEAVLLLRKVTLAKFGGSVELHINVTEKGLRGSTVLPHGTGKVVRIKVASEELISSLEKGGKIDFDVLVAQPSMMPKLAKVAKILGPRGLMPNPKNGTVGEDTDKLVKTLSGGTVQFKTEADFPIIHALVGKTSFEDKQILENIETFLKAVGRDKIRTVFLKSTMSPSILLAL